MPKRTTIKMPSKRLMNLIVNTAKKRWGNQFTIFVNLWTDGTSGMIVRSGKKRLFGLGMSKNFEEIRFENGVVTLAKCKIERNEKITELESETIG